jgi:hypothetical protein
MPFEKLKVGQHTCLYLKCILNCQVIRGYKVRSCSWVRGGISYKPIFCSGNMLDHIFDRLWTTRLIRDVKNVGFVRWQGRNANALAQYFGEDPARCPFEQGRLSWA